MQEQSTKSTGRFFKTKQNKTGQETHTWWHTAVTLGLVKRWQGSEAHGHFELWSESEASQAFMRPCLKINKYTTTAREEQRPLAILKETSTCQAACQCSEEVRVSRPLLSLHGFSSAPFIWVPAPRVSTGLLLHQSLYKWTKLFLVQTSSQFSCSGPCLDSTLKCT